QLAPFSTLVQMAIGPFVMLWVLRSFWRTRDAETFILIYTAGILMFFGYFSMSESTGFRASVEGRYLYYATPLFVAAFVFILVNRFIAALNETEALNRNLEQRAQQKNAELQANYERIREMEQAQTLAAERERIMRDMHDGVGGLLVSTLHRIESNGHEPVGDSGIATALNNALTDLRLMVDSLEIGEEDLDVALGMLRRRLQDQLQSTGIKMIWQVDALPTVHGMTPHKVLQIMRILQEGITNAIRHAQPTQLSLRAYTKAEKVVIELADNGVGLPADINKGQGTGNMHRRANDINATLTLNAISPGTRLSLTIPTEVALSGTARH
ncbi:MAG: ATP-binding protein, partial [Pseudomonadota bacterium]